MPNAFSMSLPSSRKVSQAWGMGQGGRQRETELFKLVKGDVNSEQLVKTPGKINIKSDSSAQGSSIYWKF